MARQSRSSHDGSSYPRHLEDLNAALTAPDLDTFCQLTRMGLTVTGCGSSHTDRYWSVRCSNRITRCHDRGQQGISRMFRWAGDPRSCRSDRLVAWKTTNDAILASGRDLLINDPIRLDGVDEHVWPHSRRSSVRYRHHRIDLGPRGRRTPPDS